MQKKSMLIAGIFGLAASSLTVAFLQEIHRHRTLAEHQPIKKFAAFEAHAMEKVMLVLLLQVYLKTPVRNWKRLKDFVFKIEMPGFLSSYDRW